MNLQINNRIVCWATAVFITCSGLVGCGSSDNLSRAPLTGKVTYKGQPLSHGMIGLLPTDGTKSPQGSGAIALDGSYEISTAGKSGAVVGTHKVIVQCRQEVSNEEKRQMKIGQLLIPSQYASYNRTPLEVKVNPKGTVFNIEIID